MCSDKKEGSKNKNVFIRKNFSRWAFTSFTTLLCLVAYFFCVRFSNSCFLPFIPGLCPLLSTNNCNFKMNNSYGSLYPESAYLRAHLIPCVCAGSLLFFCKRRKKKYVKCQTMFVLNYVYVGHLILSVMLGGIFQCGDIELGFVLFSHWIHSNIISSRFIINK